MSLAAFTFTGRARPVVELGIGDVHAGGGQARWDVARWDNDTARWAGQEPTWLDITCNVHQLRLEYGRRRTTERFVVGAATVLVDNASGWADPNANDEPGVLTVRPGRSIRVSIDHAVYGRRVLWRGFVDLMTPTYHPTLEDTVELAGIDALGEVNRTKVKPQPAPIGGGDTATQRMHRILNLAVWAMERRDISPSAEPLVADTLGGQIADMLGQTADSAGGSVFGDYEGRVAFRPRDWQTYTPDTPVDATIGNVDPTDICPTQWQRPFARADIATRAIMGRDLETAVVVDDPDGITRYGVEPFERVDLLTQRDSSLQMLAQRVLRIRGAATAPRVRSVSLDAETADNALDLMASVDVYRPSRYRCRLELDRGLVFDEDYFATGVVHTMTPDAWTLELNLDAAAPFAAAGGRWDGAYWDLAVWADVARAVRDLIGAAA